MIHWLRNNILIVVILLLAAFLRLHNIEGHMTFLGDEGRDAIVIYNMLHGKLTLLGPTASVGGFFMGPAYYYLVTPFFFLFNYSPVGASVMVALLSVLTVWMIYKIGKEFFNETTGYIAALLYALSPLVIIYSRSSWNPNVIPFFTVATMYTLYKAVEKKSLLLFIIVGFLFGIDIQLHYTQLFLGPVIILYVIVMYLALFHKKSYTTMIMQVLRDGGAIFTGFLLGFSPFIAFEFRHEFLNLKSILQFIFSSGDTGASANYFLTVWDVFIRIFGRLLLNFPLPNDFKLYDPQVLTVWHGGSIIVAVMTLLFAVYKYTSSFSDMKAYRQYSLLFFWLVIGILFFGLYKKNIYDYYFAFLFPLPFLFFAGLLAELYKNTLFDLKNKKLLLGIRIFIFLLLGMIISIFAYYSPVKSPLNNQLSTTKEIAEFVLDKTEGKPFNFALITGGNSDHAFKYFFLRAGKNPVTIQNSVIDPNRETVTDQLLVICDSLPCSPLGHSLWEIAGFGRAEVVGHWKVRYVEVYKLIHYKEKK